MSYNSLKAQTIGKIRSLLPGFTRGGIKQILLEAGANPERMLAIPIADKMNSPNYKTKDAIISEGFDTIYQDFEKKEADGIILSLIRVIYERNPELVTSSELETLLARDGFSLSEVVAQNKTETSTQAQELAMSLNLSQVIKNLKKVWMRLETDPEGSITAATSALESICKSVHYKCEIKLPSKETLPELLTSLRRNTNLDSFFPYGDVSKRLISSLSGLANILYLLAHSAGDRHGANEGEPSASNELAYLFVSSCDVIGAFLLQMLKLQKIRRK